MLSTLILNSFGLVGAQNDMSAALKPYNGRKDPAYINIHLLLISGIILKGLCGTSAKCLKPVVALV